MIRRGRALPLFVLLLIAALLGARGIGDAHAIDHAGPLQHLAGHLHEHHAVQADTEGEHESAPDEDGHSCVALDAATAAAGLQPALPLLAAPQAQAQSLAAFRSRVQAPGYWPAAAARAPPVA